MIRHHVWASIGVGLFTLAALVLACPSAAIASPWTLSRDELVLAMDVSFASATREYLYEESELQAYPLQGGFRSTTLSFSTRYGFTDRFEMEVRPSFKQLSYEADPVILGPPINTVEGGNIGFEEARATIVDFDSSRIGAADMLAAARYNIYRHHYLVITPEVGFKIPLGYEAPQGTFADLESLSVGDDAALGDGQIDLQAGVLFGVFVPWTRTFVRADLAYNHRFREPGDQGVVNAKIGQFLGEHFILFVGGRYAKTLFEGDSIGTTFVDTNPQQPAETFDFSTVEQRPLYLDRDYLVGEVGVIVKLGTVEVVVAYENVLHGRNYADLSTLDVGVITTFADVTAPDEPERETEPSVDETTIEEIIAPPGLQEGETIIREGEDGVQIIEQVIIEEVDPEDDTSVPEQEEPSDDEAPEEDLDEVPQLPTPGPASP